MSDDRETLERIRQTVRSYAPIAKRQRGCPDLCGCTDCEMVEDIQDALDV